MRAAVSDQLCDLAVRDPRVIIISGDHGYALFDKLRKQRPDQFLNVGIMEQAMVGFAAGLSKTGFRPIVYGLASFVPIRVLEQIKLDICFPNLPVVFLGDGAGLVYSTLGASHQCAEDVACLRPLPGIKIFSPGNSEELRISFEEAMQGNCPSYIRLGKCDLPEYFPGQLRSSEPYFVNPPTQPAGTTCLVSTGAMTSAVAPLARELGLPLVSVPRLKPLQGHSLSLFKGFSKLIVVEEHSRVGGLASILLEDQLVSSPPFPLIRSLALDEKFAQYCGSYQYALSEHGLASSQLRENILRWV